MIDGHNLQFVPALAAQRWAHAERQFGTSVLKRMVMFVLFLLGVERSVIAATLGVPLESVRTTVRVLLRDGLAALEDRRRRTATFLPPPTPPPEITIAEHSPYLVVTLGHAQNQVKLQPSDPVQIRVFLLSLLNSGLLSVTQVSEGLHLTPARVRDLAHLLKTDGGAALLDQRHGQTHDYRMTSELTGRLIQQMAAHALTGRPTASTALAQALSQEDGGGVSERTIRLHLRKLGLTAIAHQLPRLVETLKKKTRRDRSCRQGGLPHRNPDDSTGVTGGFRESAGPAA